jgi:hypothetical protein
VQAIRRQAHERDQADIVDGDLADAQRHQHRRVGDPGHESGGFVEE